MRTLGRTVWFWLLIAVLFPGRDVPAQPFRFRHLTIEDGLSQSSVNCIMQDRHGFLWFGTQDGLNRYDGYRFQVFRKDSADEGSLSHNWIWDIFEDRDGRFWLATWQGLTRYDPHTGVFKRFLPDTADPRAISGERPATVCQDRQGNIWIGIWGGGVDRYDPGTGGFVHYLHDPDNEKSLPVNFVRYVYCDSRDRLWVGTWRGLALAEREGDSITGFVHFRYDPDDPASLGGDQVMSVLEDHQGVIWVGTRGGGLNRFHEEDSSFTRYQFRKDDPASISGNDVCVLYEDSRHRFWVGTFTEGLNLFDRQKGTFLRIYQDPDDPYGLLSNSVYSISEDASGLLWVGAGGLNILDPRVNSFGYYRHQYNSKGSLSMNKITAVCQEGPGRLWIGTEAGGLNLFDMEKGTFTVFRNDPGDTGSLRGNNISSLASGGDGKIWVAIRGKGLDCYLPEKNTFRHVKTIGSLSAPEALWYINDMCFTSPDTLWLATENAGVIRYVLSSGEGVAYNTRNSEHPFPGNSLLTLWPGTGGKIWLGTWGIGLYAMDRKTGEFSYYPLDGQRNRTLAGTIIHVIREVPDRHGTQTLWVGTGNGLYSLRPGISGEMQAVRITMADGLPSNVIYGILRDDRGKMWIATNNGLCRYDPETDSTRTFDRSDGLQSNEFNGHVCLKLQDGRLFFGGGNGFNLFNPAEIRESDFMPPVVLTAFRVFNREMDFGRALTEVKRIVLSWKQNFFSFEYAALDYAQPQKIRYAYRMEGVDKDWVYSGTRRYASYTRIDPGDYVFRVKATNRDGIWSDKILSLEIKIRPPFWKTWWFRMLGIVLFLLVLYGLHRMQLQKLLAVERLRTRIASDLHDDVGAALTRISIASEQMLTTRDREKTKKLAGTIGTISREVISTMSDIIWSIDARNDTLDQLMARMQDLAFRVFSMKDIKVEFAEKGMKKKKKIPVDKRQNIFYIFKELVHNIVKHAGATEVKISLLNTEKEFVMEVADNGKGFDPEKVFRGNGLKNIRMRARRLKARLEISAEEGVRVVLRMKRL